jgi:hypothetical protein
MGMAASQSRFLALTARKSNTEYQGQQVNQQRSVLANESAGLYNKMMDLSVPTPPSANDFYSSTYTFNNGEETCYLTNIKKSTSDSNQGGYSVGIKYNTEATAAARGNSVNGATIKTADDGKNYICYNGKEYELTDVTDDVDGNANSSNPLDLKRSTLGEMNTTFNNSDSKIYSYTVDAGQDSERTCYLSESVYNTLQSGTSSAYTPVYTYQTTKSQYGTAEATLTKDESTGRYTKITLSSSTIENLNEEGISYDLSITSTKDDEAYDEAMKDYEYKKMQYEQEVDEINARTESLQQKDKSLELKLKQLDTEQNAIKQKWKLFKKLLKRTLKTHLRHLLNKKIALSKKTQALLRRLGFILLHQQ